MKKVGGLQKRWLMNTVSVVFALGMVCVLAVTASFATYYYSNMQSDLFFRARTTTAFFADYVDLSYNDYYQSCMTYAQTFEDKDTIAGIIADYNKGKPEEQQISYTDYVALMMSSVSTIIDIISYVLIAFVSISLVVSSIMIGIITYISVLERTKEIGILRSIGASKKDISRVFNAETLIVGFVSGMLGIIVTALLNIPISLIIESFTDISGLASLPIGGAVILVCISMALTLIAGLIPSRVAAKKDPVAALRTE